MKYLKLNKITNEELFLDYKQTYLNLQRALLKNGLMEESEEVGKNYAKAKETFLEKIKREQNQGSE